MGDALRFRPGRRTASALVAALVLLAVVAVQSARLGTSGLIVELAQKEIARWSSAPRSQSMANVNRIADYYADSLWFVSDNPRALEGLAALDLARMRLSTEPKEALAFTRDARRRLREALRERPASPYLWANLALSKLYLDEIDAEFNFALRNADELGPWEPATQQVVLFVALAAWHRLDSTLRDSTARVVERGGVRNSLKMFEIVKNYRRYDLVCGLRSYDVVAGTDCRRLGGAAAR